MWTSASDDESGDHAAVVTLSIWVCAARTWQLSGSAMPESGVGWSSNRETLGPTVDAATGTEANEAAIAIRRSTAPPRVTHTRTCWGTAGPRAHCRPVPTVPVYTIAPPP